MNSNSFPSILSYKHHNQVVPSKHLYGLYILSSVLVILIKIARSTLSLEFHCCHWTLNFWIRGNRKYVLVVTSLTDNCNFQWPASIEVLVSFSPMLWWIVWTLGVEQVCILGMDNKAHVIQSNTPLQGHFGLFYYRMKRRFWYLTCT